MVIYRSAKICRAVSIAYCNNSFDDIQKSRLIYRLAIMQIRAKLLAEAGESGLNKEQLLDIL